MEKKKRPQCLLTIYTFELSSQKILFTESNYCPFLGFLTPAWQHIGSLFSPPAFLLLLPEGPGHPGVPPQAQQCWAPFPLGHQKETAACFEYKHGQKQSSLCLFFICSALFLCQQVIVSHLFAAGLLAMLSSGWLLGVQPAELPLGAHLS